MEVSKQQIQTTMTQGIRSFATAHATGGEAWVQVRNREVSSWSRGFSQTHTFHLKQPYIFLMWWVAGSKNLPTLGKKMLSFPNIHTLSFPNIHTCFLHNPPSIPSSFTYIDWRHSIDLADISSWWKLHGFPSHLFHNYPPNKKVPKNDQIHKDKYPKFNSEFTLKKWVDWKTDPFPGLTLPPQHRSSNQHLGWKHKNGRSIFGYLYFVKAWVFAKLHLVVRTSQKAAWNWNIESESNASQVQNLKWKSFGGYICLKMRSAMNRICACWTCWIPPEIKTLETPNGPRLQNLVETSNTQPAHPVTPPSRSSSIFQGAQDVHGPFMFDIQMSILTKKVGKGWPGVGGYPKVIQSFRILDLGSKNQTQASTIVPSFLMCSNVIGFLNLTGIPTSKFREHIWPETIFEKY